MPSNKPKYPLTFPSLEAKRSIEAKADEAGLSLNNYILKKLGLSSLKHGGTLGNKGNPLGNPYGRKGKTTKKKD